MNDWRRYIVGASYHVSALEATAARSDGHIRDRVISVLRDTIADRIVRSLTVTSRAHDDGGEVHRCEVVVVPVSEFTRLVDREAMELASRFRTTL